MRSILLALILGLATCMPIGAIEQATDAPTAGEPSANEQDRPSETSATARRTVEAIRRLRLQPGHDAATAVAPAYQRPDQGRR